MIISLRLIRNGEYIVMLALALRNNNDTYSCKANFLNKLVIQEFKSDLGVNVAIFSHLSIR